MSTNPTRQPAGVPTGGQLAAKSNPECVLDLDDILGTNPTVLHVDGTREWYHGDQLHRDVLPAVIRPDGTQEWWWNGHRHREDGPAIVRPDGTEIWCRHGKLHRDGGPAATWPDGTQVWSVNGKGVDPPESPQPTDPPPSHRA
jgi:hypothetical protein